MNQWNSKVLAWFLLTHTKLLTASNPNNSNAKALQYLPSLTQPRLTFATGQRTHSLSNPVKRLRTTGHLKYIDGKYASPVGKEYLCLAKPSLPTKERKKPTWIKINIPSHRIQYPRLPRLLDHQCCVVNKNYRALFSIAWKETGLGDWKP
jgi:hypothetical protein